MIPIEYPRPLLYRPAWRSLNGWWEFDFYDDYFVTSPTEKIQGPLDRTIRVPFSYQSSLSGIGTGDIHERVIYRRRIRLTDEESRKRIRLHCAAVDFKAEVWIDGVIVGRHTGGYSPFYFDISSFFSEKKECTLAIIAEDAPSPEQPRGKQATGTPFSCWYTAVTGIWQSVWLEFLPETYIETFSVTTDTENGAAHYRLLLSGPCDDCHIKATAQFKGKVVASTTSRCRFPGTDITLTIADVRKWSPEEPNLYSVHFSVRRGSTSIDEVETYAAFRDLELRSDGLYINHQRYFQKLVLMQGFWEQGGYTAPEASSFEEDIQRAREMGFNGCRMHIKFEDPRFLYAADRLGFLVWAEAPSFYSFTAESSSVLRKELTDIVQRDLPHPSLTVWVIGNESWGLRDIRVSDSMRSWLKETVALTKALDPTRPVISNDGWEHFNSDCMTFHSYEQHPDALEEDWNRARNNDRCGIHRKRFDLSEQNTLHLPWVLSEFGAISYLEEQDDSEHWGYGDAADSREAFLQRFERLLLRASALDGITGWCYTQFTDIEQEKNGLLFEDRTPKLESSDIREILDRLDTKDKGN
jgi:beta-galactosidase/beta-glucuronidase